MSDRQVKVVGKHRRGCDAKRLAKSGAWSTCWGPVAWGDHGDPLITVERRYGKKGRTFRKWAAICLQRFRL